MITLQTLTQFSDQDFRRLVVGYTSPAKYVVNKMESQERTEIHLQSVELEMPYTRRWPVLADDLVRYRQMLKTGFSLSAYDEEAMVGLAIAEPITWNRTLWVWELHVAETHRRQGIGRCLVAELASRARAAGLRTLLCETQNTNVPAIHFYRRVGFELDGIDLSYYTNTDAVDGEVAIFMKYKL